MSTHYGWFTMRTYNTPTEPQHTPAASSARTSSRRDHKIIGIQFLFSTLMWFFIGGMLALAFAGNWPGRGRDMPILGTMLFAARADRSRPSSTRCCSRCTPR